MKIYSPILNIAIHKGDIKIVKLLLESGKIDVNYSIISSYHFIIFIDYFFFKTPLECAIDEKNVGIVDLLLECKDIDVNHPCILLFILFLKFNIKLI